MEAAAEQEILYTVIYLSIATSPEHRTLTICQCSIYASKTIEEIAAAKSNNTLNGFQVNFQQVRCRVRARRSSSQLLT